MAATDKFLAPLGPAPRGREGLVQGISDQTLREIEVAWADHLGHTLGKRLPAAGLLARAQGHRIGFCDATLAWDVVADVHEGARLTDWHTGFPDLFAAPDLDTFRYLP